LVVYNLTTPHLYLFVGDAWCEVALKRVGG
jgi:hypothetical protein